MPNTVFRLIREYPSVALLAVLGILFLIAYLVVRGRRLGWLDLLLFAFMAVVLDGLVVVLFGMWTPNNPFNLIVFFGLVLVVPFAVLSTLGLGIVALRVAHIALTGGPPRPQEGSQEKQAASQWIEQHAGILFKRVFLPALAAVALLVLSVVQLSASWIPLAIIAAGCAWVWWWVVQRKAAPKPVASRRAGRRPTD